MKAKALLISAILASSPAMAGLYEIQASGGGDAWEMLVPRVPVAGDYLQRKLGDNHSCYLVTRVVLNGTSQVVGVTATGPRQCYGGGGSFEDLTDLESRSILWLD